LLGIIDNIFINFSLSHPIKYKTSWLDAADLKDQIFKSIKYVNKHPIVYF